MEKEIETDSKQINKEKVYQTPSLIVMGKMTEMTKTGTNTGSDGSGNSTHGTSSQFE